MFDLVAILHEWSRKKLLEQKLDKFGGIQTCPWCRQIAQEGANWSFEQYEKDLMLDVLTCGICGGKSLWRFELGMIYHSPLESPKPAF